jgi:hypothetical protein
MSLGLFTTFHSMKRITQWPVEDMLSFQYEAGTIQLKIVGLDVAVENITFPRLPVQDKLKAAPGAAADSLIKLYQDTKHFSLKGCAALKEIVVDKLRQFR